jgi:hypothetical protein
MRVKVWSPAKQMGGTKGRKYDTDLQQVNSQRHSDEVGPVEDTFMMNQCWTLSMLDCRDVYQENPKEEIRNTVTLCPDEFKLRFNLKPPALRVSGTLLLLRESLRFLTGESNQDPLH